MIRPKLRLATNDDAKDIREILDANNQIPEGHDWGELGPYWIVAEHDDTIVGCAQVLCGKPFGHINFVAVLPGYFMAGIGFYLWKAAERILANNGCDGYTGTTSNEGVIKKLPKLNAVVFDESVKLCFKRVYRKGAKY